MEGIAEVILETAITGMLRDADRAATLAVNDFNGAFTDTVMPVLSSHPFMAAMYVILIAYLTYRLGWRKALVILIVAGVSLGLADQVANLVKHSVERFRPCWDEYMTSNGLNVLERKGSKFGFYSAHAATSTIVITVVLYFTRQWDKSRRYRLLIWLGVTWVLLISLSRVYVGKHFVGDVVAGIFAGCILSVIMIWLSRWVINRFFVKFVN